MPGSTDKNQPTSPHHPNRRKRAKPTNRKQPEVRPERYLGAPFGLDKNTEKTSPGALKTKRLKTKRLRQFTLRGLSPGGREF